MNWNVSFVSRNYPVMISKHLIPAFALLLSSLTVGHSQEDKGDATPTTFVGKTIDQMTADEVLKLVRFSYTLYNRDFTGQLTMGFSKKVPFLLSLNPDSIRFIFDNPAQLIYLDTRNQNFSLLEGIGGADMKPVNPEKYGQPIRDTDETYDDHSMRFLYWPNAKITGQEKMKGREHGDFPMFSPEEFDDIWMVDEMRIETVSGATGGTVESSTRMTIKSAVK